MRIQKARIEALEKAIQSAAGTELPMVITHLEPGVWQMGEKDMDRTEYEAIVAKYEAAGVPFLLVTTTGLDDEEPAHLAPVFLEGAGAVKGPDLSAEEWERKFQEYARGIGNSDSAD